MPVIMAEILIVLPRLVRLCCIVLSGSALGAIWSREDGRPGFEIQRDIAFEMDGIAGISAWRKANRSTACASSGFDSAVDGGSIDRFAVSESSKRSHVIDAAVFTRALSQSGMRYRG